MKRILAILLTVTMIFSFSLSAAFADDGEMTEETAAEAAQEQPAEAPAPAVTVAKVTGADADALSSSSIKITWKGVSGAAGYKVYRYSSSKGKYVRIKTVTSGKTHYYKNTGLKSSKTYSYKVAAYKKADGKVINGTKSSKTSAKTKSASSKAVSIAKGRIGSRYVSGCCGPTKFDCSGLVYYVYVKKDASRINFKRSSAQGEYNQLKKYKVGSSVKSAKKGDILFFSSSGRTSGIYHTGIYIGNGTMVHAAGPGKGVRTCKTKYVPRVCAVVRLPK